MATAIVGLAGSSVMPDAASVLVDTVCSTPVSAAAVEDAVTASIPATMRSPTRHGATVKP